MMSHAPLAPYHYASHYSNSGVVLHYLLRLMPYTHMFLNYQGNNIHLINLNYLSFSLSCFSMELNIGNNNYYR